MTIGIDFSDTKIEPLKTDPIRFWRIGRNNGQRPKGASAGGSSPCLQSKKANSSASSKVYDCHESRCKFALHLVAQFYGVDSRDLLSCRRQDAFIASRRQLAAYIAHTSLGVPYAKIGHCLMRDRTTISHACKTIEDRRDEPEFDRELTKLEAFVATLLYLAPNQLGRLTKTEIKNLLLVTD